MDTQIERQMIRGPSLSLSEARRESTPKCLGFLRLTGDSGRLARCPPGSGRECAAQAHGWPGGFSRRRREAKGRVPRWERRAHSSRGSGRASYSGGRAEAGSSGGRGAQLAMLEGWEEQS